MDSAVNLGVILRFLLRTLGVFALIFILALLTPKIAAWVDRWIARYRENHDPKKDETYGVRSPYDFPAPREEDPEALDIPTDDVSVPDTPPDGYDDDDDEYDEEIEDYDEADRIPLAAEVQNWNRFANDAESAPAEEQESATPWFMR